MGQTQWSTWPFFHQCSMIKGCQLLECKITIKKKCYISINNCYIVNVKHKSNLAFDLSFKLIFATPNLLNRMYIISTNQKQKTISLGNKKHWKTLKKSHPQKSSRLIDFSCGVAQSYGCRHGMLMNQCNSLLAAFRLYPMAAKLCLIYTVLSNRAAHQSPAASHSRR